LKFRKVNGTSPLITLLVGSAFLSGNTKVSNNLLRATHVKNFSNNIEPHFRKDLGFFLLKRSSQLGCAEGDGLVKSPLAPFRSWFDTSPRTENQMVTAHPVRSP
jgi:hypothetical protein